MKRFITSTKFPFWFIHLPIVPYILYLGLKARSLTFFTAVNPTIHAGGFLNSKKYNLLEVLPNNTTPKSILIKNFSTRSFDDIIKLITVSKISFPVVIKPNEGERGLGVKILREISQLKSIHSNYHFDAIIQEFIDLDCEFGILIHWNYKSNKPKITSLTYKELPFVIGEGNKTLNALIKEKYKKYNLPIVIESPTSTIQDGSKLNLNSIAHRSTGTKFICLNSHIEEKLNLKVWSVLKNIKDFQYGRIDVKANSLEELLEFENIKILEVNGVNSVPIHAFDSKYDLLEMYTIFIKHWKIIFHIYIQNKAIGIKPLPLYSFFKEVIKKKYNE